MGTIDCVGAVCANSTSFNIRNGRTSCTPSESDFCFIDLGASRVIFNRTVVQIIKLFTSDGISRCSIYCAIRKIGNLALIDIDIVIFSIQCYLGTSSTAGCLTGNRSDIRQVLGQLDGEAASFGNTIVQRIIVFCRSRHHADVIAGQLGCISDTACNTQRMIGCRGIQPGIRRGIGLRAAGFHRIAGETDAVLQVGNVVIARFGTVVDQTAL